MSRRPLLFQLTALLLMVLLAVQAISFSVVLLTPTPTSPSMNLPQAIAALDSDAAASAAGLTRTRRSTPPNGPPVELLAGAAAEALGRQRESVRVVWRRPGHAEHAEIQVLTSSTGADGKPVAHRSDTAATQAWLLQPALLQPGLELPPFALAVRQRDGDWLTVEPPDRLFPLWRQRLLLSTSLGLLALLPLSWWAARRLTRPARELAAAAAQADLDGAGDPLLVDGPTEIRAAAQAFNAMRERLRAQADERTRMVAAVAHDLRTPLTSLRLRAESAPEGDRQRMVADIERMDSMISRVVEYAHSEQSEHRPERFDLGTLVCECTEAASEQGQAISCEVPRSAPVQADELALRRAINNLIDNACRYAGRAELHLHRDIAGWILDVDDWGPGVPAEQLALLTQPFRRLDESRNVHTGGVGLGLAVVRSVAQRHGGSLELSNRAAGGLRARLRIPDRSPQSGGG